MPVLVYRFMHDGWTVSNIPSGGTLSSVTTSSNTAKLMITEGPGAADTSVGTLTVSLAAPGGIKDCGRTLCLVRLDHPHRRAAPVLMSLVSLQSGGTAGNGKMEAGDKLVLTYSEAVTGMTASPAVVENRGNGNVTLNIVGFTTTPTRAQVATGDKNTTIYLDGSGGAERRKHHGDHHARAASGSGSAAASSGASPSTSRDNDQGRRGNAAVTTFTTPLTFALF